MLSRKDLRRNGHVILRVFAVFMLCFVALVAISMLVNGIIDIGTQANERQAHGGVLDLTAEEDLSSLFLISGEWELYLGGQYVPDALDEMEAEYAFLPRLTVRESGTAATLRLKILTNPKHGGKALAAYINDRDTDMQMYFNGVLVGVNVSGATPKTMMEETVAPLMLDGDGEQELVIAVSDVDLFTFQNQLKLSDGQTLATNLEVRYTVNYFMVGLLTVLLIVGLSFMVMHPQHIFISTLAIFDFFIIMRALLGVPELYEIMFVVAGDSFLPIALLQRVLIVSYLIACLFDCRMASIHFEQEGKRHEVWARRGTLCVLILLAMVLPSSFLPLRIAIVVFAAWTLLSRIVGIALRLKGNRSLREYSRAVRILVIVLVLSYDALVLTGLSPHYESMLYVYAGLSVMHLIVRLWDNFKTYNKAYQLNLNLEGMVDERTAQLMEVNEKLSKLSIHDPLTGAFNRLHFENRTEVLLKRSDELSDICLSIMDIDYFKRINDTYGHDMGDKVLRRFVRLVQANLREPMTLYRVGGEEFVVFSHSVPPQEFVAQMDRIRHIISQANFPHGDTLTASIGVARFLQGQSVKGMLKEADACLYEAKNSGRNKLIHHIDFENAERP